MDIIKEGNQRITFEELKKSDILSRSNKTSAREPEKTLAEASAFFNDVFRKRNVMFPSEVMCASRVKCAFGT